MWEEEGFVEVEVELRYDETTWTRQAKVTHRHKAAMPVA